MSVTTTNTSERTVSSFDPNLDCIACPTGFLKVYNDGVNRWITCSNKNNPCIKEACTQPYILSTKVSNCFVCGDKIKPVISNLQLLILCNCFA